jgi:hypothetical protein
MQYIAKLGVGKVGWQNEQGRRSVFLALPSEYRHWHTARRSLLPMCHAYHGRGKKGTPVRYPTAKPLGLVRNEPESDQPESCKGL